MHGTQDAFLFFKSAVLAEVLTSPPAKTVRAQDTSRQRTARKNSCTGIATDVFRHLSRPNLKATKLAGGTGFAVGDREPKSLGRETGLKKRIRRARPAGFSLENAGAKRKNPPWSSWLKTFRSSPGKNAAVTFLSKLNTFVLSLSIRFELKGGKQLPFFFYLGLVMK